MPKKKKQAPSIEDVRALGYEVAEAFTIEDVVVWRVEGPGISLMVREDDHEALASLADPDAHAERETQQGEALEDTIERVSPPDE